MKEVILKKTLTFLDSMVKTSLTGTEMQKSLPIIQCNPYLCRYSAKGKVGHWNSRATIIHKIVFSKSKSLSIGKHFNRLSIFDILCSRTYENHSHLSNIEVTSILRYYDYYVDITSITLEICQLRNLDNKACHLRTFATILRQIESIMASIFAQNMMNIDALQAYW